MNGTQRPQPGTSHGDEDARKRKLKFTNMEVEILVQAVLVTHEDVLQARNTSPGQINKIWNVWWLLNKQMYHFRVCSLGCLYITMHHPVTVLRILVQLLISYRIIPGV